MSHRHVRDIETTRTERFPLSIHILWYNNRFRATLFKFVLEHRPPTIKFTKPVISVVSVGASSPKGEALEAIASARCKTVSVNSPLPLYAPHDSNTTGNFLEPELVAIAQANAGDPSKGGSRGPPQPAPSPNGDRPPPGTRRGRRHQFEPAYRNVSFERSRLTARSARLRTGTPYRN
ncbi:hypothetical protein EVAR_51290_1 [Eumeta japonica]|uniref:Uncharacterized protein n=1 Tax=Eumeta variegata TaxID=151549 RepID=A0A4C1XQI4_EUMVA|nr:hypothetical protein EVAR_51290_1 [Eumeta japonica]